MRSASKSPRVRIVALLVLLCLPGFRGRAAAFPFRTFEIGDRVPAADFVDYKDHRHQTLAALQGKNALVVFWGADLPEKREHSVMVLKQLAALANFFKEREITLLSVNIQSDPVATIDEVLASAGSADRVFVDPSRQAYGSLGIYVMPALLLIDRDGRVISGLGYSRNSVDHLKDEITILTGEKTRARIEAEAKAAAQESPAAGEQATCHLNFAVVLLKRGQIESAIREFELALSLDAGLGEAAVQLGCLYLEQGDLPRAAAALGRAAILRPDSLPSRLCAARLQASQGQAAAARQALEELKSLYPDSPRIDYLLGRLWEDQGQSLQAAGYYRRACDLLNAAGCQPPGPAQPAPP